MLMLLFALNIFDSRGCQVQTVRQAFIKRLSFNSFSLLRSNDSILGVKLGQIPLRSGIEGFCSQNWTA